MMGLPLSALRKTTCKLLSAGEVSATCQWMRKLPVSLVKVSVIRLLVPDQAPSWRQPTMSREDGADRSAAHAVTNAKPARPSTKCGHRIHTRRHKGSGSIGI